MNMKLNLLTGLVSTTIFLGCDKVDSTPRAPDVPSTIAMDTAPPSTVEIHAHPSEGPHHGTLIELGKEEFHAELVHDDKSVVIYILDSAAKNAVPIETAEVIVNLMHDGKPEQFKLAANADATDPSGKSSRFQSNEIELVKHLDDESAAPKLSVSINGKAYRGVISHDHAGHTHAY